MFIGRRDNILLHIIGHKEVTKMTFQRDVSLINNFWNEIRGKVFVLFAGIMNKMLKFTYEAFNILNMIICPYLELMDEV
jgi:hypothetical protein